MTIIDYAGLACVGLAAMTGFALSGSLMRDAWRYWCRYTNGCRQKPEVADAE